MLTYHVMKLSSCVVCSSSTPAVRMKHADDFLVYHTEQRLSTVRPWRANLFTLVFSRSFLLSHWRSLYLTNVGSRSMGEFANFYQAQEKLSPRVLDLYNHLLSAVKRKQSSATLSSVSESYIHAHLSKKRLKRERRSIREDR